MVEFDAAEQEFNLEQARFDLQLAEQEIVKADAQAAVQIGRGRGRAAARALRRPARRARPAEQRAGDRDQGAAERADARRGEAAARAARGRRQDPSRDHAAHRPTVVREKRNKAQLSVQVAERNIESLHVRAPFDGVVTVRTNFQAFGGIYFGGAMPDYRIGDAAFAGQPIAEVIDSSHDRSHRQAGGAGSRQCLAGPDGRGRRRRAARCDAARDGPQRERRRLARNLRRGHAAVRHRLRRHRQPGGAARRVGRHRDRRSGLRQRPLHPAHGGVRRQRTADGLHPGGRRLRRARSPGASAWTDSVAVVENIEQAAEVALVDPNTPSGGRAKTPPQAPQRASR